MAREAAFGAGLRRRHASLHRTSEKVRKSLFQFSFRLCIGRWIAEGMPSTPADDLGPGGEFPEVLMKHRDQNDLLLQRVDDVDTVMQVAASIRPMLDEQVHFSIEWLRSRGWTAVPVADTPNDMDAEWISEAAQRIGCSEAFAISTELDSLRGPPDCYRLVLNQEELLALEPNLAFRPFIVTPELNEFAILLEGEYFFVVAGPETFVRRAIGCSFGTAKAMFIERYAQSEHWPIDTRDYLMGVWDRYGELIGV